VIRRGALIVGCALAVIGGTAAAADAPTRDVAIPGKAYEPARITVLVGTTVTWRNGDSLNHTVSADNDAFDSGYLAPGGSFSYTFARQGHYAYNCLIHKFMKGSVDVFSLVLTGPERPVLAGKQVVVAGLAPAGTATVTLTKIGGEEPARTVKARPDGSFTVLFRATTPGAYRATVSKATSPVVRISVVPRLTVTHTASAVSVTADPARPGAPVALQAYDRDHFTWRTIARARLDPHSHSRVAIPLPQPDRVRIVVRGHAGWSDAASPAIVLRR
jgi:plastocyanin